MDLSRVVDVSARKSAGGFSFGSGYLIAPGLVLTARHVVYTDNGDPHNDVRVRFLEAGVQIDCHVVWPGRPDLDVALLRCPVRAEQDPPVRWGKIIASESGVQCDAAGFPRSMEQEDGLRDIEHARGQINPGTGLLGTRIYMDVASAPADPGDWGGMSGAALWCGHLLIGVVSRVPEKFAAGRLAAEPAGRFLEDPGFQGIVGISHKMEPVGLSE